MSAKWREDEKNPWMFNQMPTEQGRYDVMFKKPMFGYKYGSAEFFPEVVNEDGTVSTARWDGPDGNVLAYRNFTGY